VTSEWWFTGNDLEKADSVVFAKNRQEPAFVSFLKGVHEALPEGWEMDLSTHEGHMNPPEGLEEPLFVLTFEDPGNSFTLPVDPAGTARVPSLRLYFYDIAEKEAVMAIVNSSRYTRGISPCTMTKALSTWPSPRRSTSTPAITERKT
jgi:hypothetical protein